MRLQQAGAARSSGSGVSIRDLRTDAQKLARGEFEQRHGRAFLLLSATDFAPPALMTTEVSINGGGPARMESTSTLSLIVYAVRRNGRSAGHLITLGRAPDNDVVVPDASISRFHAYVKEGANRQWLIQDAGSTNGTAVNGHAVPRQGSGSPIELSSGDDVRLGQVELTFLDVDALLSFALRVER
jgi:FHA domain